MCLTSFFQTSRSIHLYLLSLLAFFLFLLILVSASLSVSRPYLFSMYP